VPVNVNDLPGRIRQIVNHVAPLHAEADVPIEHHRRLSNDAWNLLLYVRRHLGEATTYGAVLERHLYQLRRMVLLNLIEAFERYLKELAAVCVDHVARRVPDDRLDKVSKGSGIASHFAAATIGRAVCESLNWLDCDEINERFRWILAPPYEAGSFYVFPRGTQQPAALRDRLETARTIFQLRHTLAHNLGVITASDALKLRLLTRGPVEENQLLLPTHGDVWYVKLWLAETVDKVNAEVATALADLLTQLHGQDATLLIPGDVATELAQRFRVGVTVAGVAAAP